MWLMARLCERPGCSERGSVAYGFDADRLLVWLGAFDPDIERKEDPGAGWHAHDRKAVGPRRRGHDPERPVATGHAESIRRVGHGFIDEGCQVVLRTEDEGLDPSLARPLDQPCLRCPAAAGPRVDEQDRPTGRVDRPPAVPRQTSHDPLILRSGAGSALSRRRIGLGRRANESKPIEPASAPAVTAIGPSFFNRSSGLTSGHSV